MNNLYQQILTILVAGSILFWLWRRLFHSTGKLVLAGSWIVFTAVAFANLEAALIILTLLFALLAALEIWRRASFPHYSPAVAAFETNQVLRGLTPVEAGYFIHLLPDQIFIIAMLNLVDKEVLMINPDTCTVGVKPEYLCDRLEQAADDRRRSRNMAAKERGLILLEHDHVFLELIRDQSTPLSALNVRIWYRFLENSLNRFSIAYDLEQTRNYAFRIVGKITTPGSRFSYSRRDLSGWYAIRHFSDQFGDKIVHRPAWLTPDDDFYNIIESCLKSVEFIS